MNVSGDKYNNSVGEGTAGSKAVSSPSSLSRVFGIDFTSGHSNPESNGAHSMPDEQQ